MKNKDKFVLQQSKHLHKCDDANARKKEMQIKSLERIFARW